MTNASLSGMEVETARGGEMIKKKFALEREIPKVVKGLSSMHFTIKQWKEIALSDDEVALNEYAKSLHEGIVWRIRQRVDSN